ncbi:competence protein CoiA family protein [Endozoicomonas lisbonensis]|uniref:competence protein CoiA family protein n=1 Tax=Endozoicomonas lisbonensis TaxID=3120522 RepID=UPI00339478F4
MTGISTGKPLDRTLLIAPYFKDLLAQELRKEYGTYLNTTPIIEYPIHEVKRIADVVFEFPNGWLEAHEVQFSSITPAELEERTNDYKKAGIDVVWWLGKSADTQPNREWVREVFGRSFHN